MHILRFVYYNYVKFHQYRFNHLGGVALTRHLDRRNDRVFPIYPPPPKKTHNAFQAYNYTATDN